MLPHSSYNQAKKKYNKLGESALTRATGVLKQLAQSDSIKLPDFTLRPLNLSVWDQISPKIEEFAQFSPEERTLNWGGYLLKLDRKVKKFAGLMEMSDQPFMLFAATLSASNQVLSLRMLERSFQPDLAIKGGKGNGAALACEICLMEFANLVGSTKLAVVNPLSGAMTVYRGLGYSEPFRRTKNAPEIMEKEVKHV